MGDRLGIQCAVGITSFSFFLSFYIFYLFVCTYACKNVLIRFKVICFVSKTLPKRMPRVCVTCCVWSMLSDNDVRDMTSSLTTTSPLSVNQPSRKGEDVCEIRSSLFCAPQHNHYSNDTVGIRLGCLLYGETG